ncbi:uncharacterized protein [Rutidosis leptorrhynchoides]|uniref:uncharacterized protein isoform X2 n=1 Tax=Rutidosis leptorrhynchoides TaxID=125765 RepID=UPI003A9A623F
MEDYRKHVFCSTSLNSPIALLGLPYKVEWHIRKGKERSLPVKQCYNVKLVTHLHAPGCPLVQIWMRLVFRATYLNSTFSLLNCCIKSVIKQAMLYRKTGDQLHILSCPLAQT